MKHYQHTFGITDREGKGCLVDEDGVIYLPHLNGANHEREYSNFPIPGMCAICGQPSDLRQLGNTRYSLQLCAAHAGLCWPSQV